MYSTTAIFRLRLHNLSLALLLCFIACTSNAQGSAKKSDVRLIIDVSGSMKKNDPNNLRQPAVDLLVRLLPEGSKAGVWTFGKYVNMLIPHQKVDEAWRQMARNKAGEINSVALFTNIGEALEKAAHDSRRPSSKHNTSVILLTDGMVDVSKSPEDNQKEWRRIVDEVLPELKNAHFTIHTVGLSENADTHLLEKIAVTTDGTSAIAYNAEDLMKIFLKAFDVAAPSQQVPLEGNTFAVDSSVEEFTALIFRVDSKEQAQLVGPDKAVYNAQTKAKDVSWLRTNRYDLITVKRPVEGEWTLQADIDPDSRITIVSDMTLKVKTLPNNVLSGAEEKLSFVLQEDGNTITRSDFLSILDSSVVMSYGPKDVSTGQIWHHEFDKKVISKRGVFKVALPDLKKMGVYDIALVVDGKTFKRTFKHRMTVRQPFTASLDEALDDNGVEQYVLTVRSHSDTLDVKRTQVAATVVNPKRRRSVKPLSFTELDYWQTIIHADEVGEYIITVKITGKGKDGEPFEHTLDPIKLSHDPDAAFDESEPVVEPMEEIEEPAVEPEPIAEPEEAVAESELEEEPEPAPEGIPSWLMYAALAFGNLLILGGGYFLFKKLSSRGGEDEILTELSEDESEMPEEEVSKVEAEPALESLSEVSEPESNVGDMTMEVAEEHEEPPPMEDLDGLLDESVGESVDEPESPDKGDDMDMAQAMAMEAASAEASQPPVIDDKVSEEDLEDDEVDSDAGGLEDVEAEMREAQGLDLAEDELDDAINNLIDDLDTGQESVEDENDDFDDLDGIDFDEEDK